MLGLLVLIPLDLFVDQGPVDALFVAAAFAVSSLHLAHGENALAQLVVRKRREQT